jgi:hypothetical protein
MALYTFMGRGGKSTEPGEGTFVFDVDAVEFPRSFDALGHLITSITEAVSADTWSTRLEVWYTWTTGRAR